jgi:hypothetical protein
LHTKGFTMDILFPILLFMLVVASGLFYASVFEWTLHRYVMHRPLGSFRYPFEAHAGTHHRLFRADASYHFQGIDDTHTKIPMAWWNGPVIVLVGVLPFALVALTFARYGWEDGAPIVFGAGMLVSAGYFIAYEYFHWCMHMPKGRWFETTRIFKKMNGHHILHHRYMSKNFNVVLPIADYLFGTLLTRSPVRFAQVRGSSVPDLQPW